MDNWRDSILDEFVPGTARLTLVDDPDGLLREEGLLDAIRARGFELMAFEDRVAFRYEYETRIRCRWDRGEPLELIVVSRSPASGLDRLPHDLLQAGRRISFSIGRFSRISATLRSPPWTGGIWTRCLPRSAGIHPTNLGRTKPAIIFSGMFSTSLRN